MFLEDKSKMMFKDFIYSWICHIF